MNRARLASLWLLLREPGAWSARRYAQRSRLYLAALMPHTWRS